MAPGLGWMVSGPLTRAARSAFAAVRAAHPEEIFYYFALDADESGPVIASAIGERGYAATVEQYRRDYPDPPDFPDHPEHAESLRFSTADSPYHDLPLGTVLEHASFLVPSAVLRDACFRALRTLDEEGAFGVGAARDAVVINVLGGGRTHERWLAHARRLNGAASLQRALPFLRIRERSANTRSFGPPAQQVWSLALSLDRRRLALVLEDDRVVGIDRATGALWLDRQAPGAARRCAFAGDGQRLYVADTVGVLELDGRRVPRRVVELQRPTSMIVAGGGALFVGGENELVCLEPTGTRRWSRPLGGMGDLALSPDEAAIAVPAPDEGASLLVLDARTGEVRTTFDLRGSDHVEAAWLDSGTLVAGATLDWLRRSERASLHWLGVDGTEHRVVERRRAIAALAVSPSGDHLAFSERGGGIVVLDREGRERDGATGPHESIRHLCFTDETTLLAAGSDTNVGPAVLEVRLATRK